MTLHAALVWLLNGATGYFTFCVVATSSWTDSAIKQRMDELVAYATLTGLDVDGQLAALRVNPPDVPSGRLRFWEWRRIRTEHIEFCAHRRVTRNLHERYMAVLDAEIERLHRENERLRTMAGA